MPLFKLLTKDGVGPLPQCGRLEVCEGADGDSEKRNREKESSVTLVSLLFYLNHFPFRFLLKF